MNSTQPVLDIVGLRAGYGGLDALHGVDLTVEPGQVVALLGPNGAGKSTLLRTVAGLVAPSGGTISMMGRNVVGASPSQLARAGVCLIPEGRGVFPSLTVAENLRLQSFLGTPPAEIYETAFAQFPRLGERRSQLAGTLSGGEQQMLALARALATDPALIMLDELSMGLAPLIVEELYRLVSTIAAQGRSLLIVEQFAQAVLPVSDVAAIMLHGQITDVGEPDHIESLLSEAYLGGHEQPS